MNIRLRLNLMASRMAVLPNASRVFFMPLLRHHAAARTSSTSIAYCNALRKLESSVNLTCEQDKYDSKGMHFWHKTESKGFPSMSVSMLILSIIESSGRILLFSFIYISGSMISSSTISSSCCCSSLVTILLGDSSVPNKLCCSPGGKSDLKGGESYLPSVKSLLLMQNRLISQLISGTMDYLQKQNRNQSCLASPLPRQSAKLLGRVAKRLGWNGTCGSVQLCCWRQIYQLASPDGVIKFHKSITHLSE